MIEITSFDGVKLFRLVSDELSVSVMEYGATVTDVCWRGKHVGLGYRTVEEYKREPCFVGAAIGRFANRIGGGAFTLGDRRYELSRNEGGNTLHGGADSWDRRLWRGEIVGSSVRMTLVSPDGDNGFPGNLTATVTYTVTGGELRIDFAGHSDADTVYAPTTHMYFNLNEGGSVFGTEMQIGACGVLEVDEALIPTGRVLPAEGDFDFSVPRPVTRDYDHCFVLDSEQACTATAGGVKLTLTTDFPAMQFYTGAYLTEPFGPNGGFAVEPEFYPDAPNHPDFPSVLLRAGEDFRKYAVFAFSEA